MPKYEKINCISCNKTKIILHDSVFTQYQPIEYVCDCGREYSYSEFKIMKEMQEKKG